MCRLSQVLELVNTRGAAAGGSGHYPPEAAPLWSTLRMLTCYCDADPLASIPKVGQAPMPGGLACCGCMGAGWWMGG